MHGSNAVIMLLDLAVARYPLYLKHFWQPLLYVFLYVLFNGLYVAAGGTDSYGNHHIYEVLNYKPLGNSLILLALVLFVFLPLIFAGQLGWVRLFVRLSPGTLPDHPARPPTSHPHLRQLLAPAAARRQHAHLVACLIGIIYDPVVAGEEGAELANGGLGHRGGGRRGIGWRSEAVIEGREREGEKGAKGGWQAIHQHNGSGWCKKRTWACMQVELRGRHRKRRHTRGDVFDTWKERQGRALG